MTQYTPVLTRTVTAAGAVARGRAVGFDGAQIATAGAKPLGIAHHAASTGQQLAVGTIGSVIAEAGAEITVGQALALDSSGRVVPAAALAVAAGATPVTSGAANGAAVLTGGVTPQHVVGDALQAASGAGQFLEILLRR